MKQSEWQESVYYLALASAHKKDLRSYLRHSIDRSELICRIVQQCHESIEEVGSTMEDMDDERFDADCRIYLLKDDDVN